LGGTAAATAVAPTLRELPYPLPDVLLSVPPVVPASPDEHDLLVSNLSVDTLVSPDLSRTSADAR